MEIQTLNSHLNLAITRLWVFAFMLVAGRIDLAAETNSKGGGANQPLAFRMTAWQDDVAGLVRFLHVMFPDISPKSKMIVISDRDWEHAPAGLGSFAMYVCEPDSRRRDDALHDTLNRYDVITRADVRCSTLILGASYLSGGSQLGPVPSSIMTC